MAGKVTMGVGTFIPLDLKTANCGAAHMRRDCYTRGRGGINDYRATAIHYLNYQLFIYVSFKIHPSAERILNLGIPAHICHILPFLFFPLYHTSSPSIAHHTFPTMFAGWFLKLTSPTNG